MAQQQPKVSLERHQRTCTICAHEQKEDIEGAFVAWRSPASIAVEFHIADRASVYRHAHACGLFAKRGRNLKAALSVIIEKAGDVEATAATVVAANQAYAKINSAGEWIDRTETVSLNELFDRMTTPELESYVQSGTLSVWFRSTVGATVSATSEEGSYGG